MVDPFHRKSQMSLLKGLLDFYAEMQAHWLYFEILVS